MDEVYLTLSVAQAVDAAMSVAEERYGHRGLINKVIPGKIEGSRRQVEVRLRVGETVYRFHILLQKDSSQWLAKEVKEEEMLTKEQKKVLEKLNIAEEDIPEAVEILKKSGVPTPAEIREKQLNRFVDLGFHTGYGMTGEELVNLTPLPEQGRENPLLVMPQMILTQNRIYVLDLTRMMELLVVDGKKGKNYLDLTQVKDLVEVPRQPYWIYEVEDGKKMKGISPNNCVKQFKKEGRRGLIAQEGIALMVQCPDVLKDHYVDLPGSCCGSGGVPCLSFWSAGPGLGSCWAGHVRSDYGSASCRS